MKLKDTPATRDLNTVYREIQLLELEPNVAELEVFGFTVIEDAMPMAAVERAREVILDLAEQRMGRRPDLDNEPSLEGFAEYEAKTDPAWRAHQQWELFTFLLFRDPVFEDFLLNPKPLALLTYLLGQSCLLSSMTCHFKGPGEQSALGLHSDNGNGLIAPFPPYSQVANCNYALTDYSEEGGALAVVPGSHRLARQPVGREGTLGGEHGNPNAIPLEIPAGSAVVWHGNTWHGSYPRSVAGIRMNLATYFCRQQLQTQERYKDNVPEDVLERRGNDPRFRTLMGGDTSYGWTEDGPTAEHRLRSRAGANWFS